MYCNGIPDWAANVYPYKFSIQLWRRNYEIAKRLDFGT